ncbi:MAG: hypoxanthine phosphoribosyltransferase [Thermodesulfobacteriota bacterium]
MSKLELVISRQRIAAKVTHLARRISQDYAGQELVLIGVLNGVFIFISDLARKLTIPTRVDFIRLASYGSESASSGRIEMTKDVETDLEGRAVLIVEDIVDSGLTLHWLKNHLAERGAISVKTCVLINKLERRTLPVELDYVGFEVEKGFLVGYGLDYDGQHRCLPEVYHLVLT